MAYTGCTSTPVCRTRYRVATLAPCIRVQASARLGAALPVELQWALAQTGIRDVRPQSQIEALQAAAVDADIRFASKNPSQCERVGRDAQAPPRP